MTNKSAIVTVCPQFHDVDMYGVVWHGHYFKYFEIARLALLKHLGLKLKDFDDRGVVVPVVDCGCRFTSPLRYDEPVTVRATLTEWENKLRIEYEICDQTGDKKLARGYTIQVLLDAKRGEVVFPIPRWIAEHINREPEVPTK